MHTKPTLCAATHRCHNVRHAWLDTLNTWLNMCVLSQGLKRFCVNNKCVLFLSPLLTCRTLMVVCAAVSCERSSSASWRAASAAPDASCVRDRALQTQQEISQYSNEPAFWRLVHMYKYKGSGVAMHNICTTYLIHHDQPAGSVSIAPVNTLTAALRACPAFVSTSFSNAASID